MCMTYGWTPSCTAIRMIKDGGPEGSTMAAARDAEGPDAGAAGQCLAICGRTMPTERGSTTTSWVARIEPAVVQIHHWRPDPTEVGKIRDEDIAMYGGIARKP